MATSASTRKLLLIVHVVSSVGWLGAVAAFLALAVRGLTSADAEQVRACYLGAATVGWCVIVPASAASLVSGVIQALATEWGLVRHYWVFIKLVLNTLACTVLALHMAPIDRVATAVTEMPLGAGLHAVRVQLVVDAAAAIVLLLVATVLSIAKPRGLIRYGRAVRSA